MRSHTLAEGFTVRDSELHGDCETLLLVEQDLVRRGTRAQVSESSPWLLLLDQL